MIWNKLVDRCLLFTDAPGGLLKELLKEAEEELANKLMIFESLYKITVPSTDYGFGQSPHENLREHNYAKLPLNYLQDIGVTHKGTHLRKMTENEINRTTIGQSYKGTPTAYSISGEYIVFNTAPTELDDFILHYKSRLTEQTLNKVLTILYYIDGLADYLYLDTPLGPLLDGHKINFEAQTATLGGGTNSLSTLRLSAGLPDTALSNKAGAIITGQASNRLGSRYTVTLSLSGSLSTSFAAGDGSMVTIDNYRKHAPLIPEQFHTDLCSYAIAIANAKSSPETYNQYWTQWMMNMDNLVNEAADRDLIFSVREEI